MRLSNTELENNMGQRGIQKVIDNDDKHAVIAHIKTVISSHGSINTKDACADSLPERKFRIDDHSENDFYESISAILVNTGKYIREKRDDGKGYNVLLNPTYEYSRRIVRNGRASWFIASVAAFIALLTFIYNVVYKCK